MNLLKDVDLLDFEAEQESQSLRPAWDLVEETKKTFTDTNHNWGLRLPWQYLEDKFALRPAEVTIWAGINGHGKSQVLNQVIGLTMAAEPWLLASMEMPLNRTMNRLVRQMGGVGNPTEDYIERIVGKTKDGLWLYDQIDTVPAERIMAMIHYAATRLPVKHIAIDSLVKCGLGVDNYNGQAMFVDKLAWAAKRYDIHIHLVHHIRKGEKEGMIPDKFDVKGAGELVDLVDNLIIFHRNKNKEDKARRGKLTNEELVKIPDNKLIVAKQRHGTGWEGQLNLYHEPESLQYLPYSGSKLYQVAA